MRRTFPFASLIILATLGAQRLPDSGITIPCEVSADGAVYVRVKVNGSEGSFILDTGSHGFSVDAEFAKRAGLAVQSGAVARGTGNDVFPVGIARGVVVSIPGINMAGQTVVVLSLKPLEPITGHPLDGILGSGFLSQYAVQVDSVAGRLLVSDFKSFQYAGHGAGIPIRIDQNGFPIARLRISMSPGSWAEDEFLIDSGANTAVDLFGPFIERHHLVRPELPTLSTSGAGVGGAAALRLARAHEVQLGSFRLSLPIVALAPDTEGVQTVQTGLMGSEILRRFTVTWDYEHRQVYLEPNSNFRQSFEVDMSGLRFRRESDGFRVSRVVPESPAALAGIKPDDMLIDVDGRKASVLTKDELTAYLKRPGERRELVLRRGSQSLRVQLVLKRLL